MPVAGGLAVTVFGKTLSVLPSVQLNTQIDGFKMWDSSKPFGIPFPAGGIDLAQWKV